MPSVIFHVRGKKFRPEAALEESKLKPYRVHHAGEIYRAGTTGKRKSLSFVFKDSGFSVDLGPKRSDDLAKQIVRANAFVKKHYSTIKRLEDADDLRLDFGYCRRSGKDGKPKFVQCDYFPADFLRLCGELNIGIELSHYHS